MMHKSFSICLLLLLAPALLLAASGVEGRVAWRGQLVPGLSISAYGSLQQLQENQPLAVSSPSQLDGTYRLELPPGSYYLLARDFSGKPQPGNYFCYYSGSPVVVAETGYRQVGFNLIKVPQEAQPQSGKRSGIKGRISFADEPLEKAYLYIYQDYKKNFKGPAYYIQPVSKGDFRLSLPPGEYYILARKRARGGQFGPVEIDDYFNYYYGNPIRIEKNQVKQIELEAIQRLSMLEEAEGVFQGVTGQILGAAGAPQAGLRVFAYRRAEMTGMPAFFSAPSDPQGNFKLPIPELGSFYLLARKSFGGPAGNGELYGKYLGRADHRIELTGTQRVEEIRIDVAPSQ
jgi:hypothetical protein